MTSAHMPWGSQYYQISSSGIAHLGTCSGVGGTGLVQLSNLTCEWQSLQQRIHSKYCRVGSFLTSERCPEDMMISSSTWKAGPTNNGWFSSSRSHLF